MFPLRPGAALCALRPKNPAQGGRNQAMAMPRRDPAARHDHHRTAAQPETAPAVRAVLDHAGDDHDRLYDAVGRGRLADLRHDGQCARPRPGRPRPVRAALPARRGGRADHRSLRPPRHRAHLPDRQGGVRAPARLRQRARMAQPRRDVRHPPGGRGGARLRDAHPARAAPEPGAAAPPAARDRGVGERGPDRHHLRAGARRPHLCVRSDHGLRVLRRRVHRRERARSAA